MRTAARILLASEGAGVLLVLALAGRLPERVAIELSDTADGFMARGSFVGATIALILILPSILWWLQFNSRARARLNIPHERFWFAPERRQETVEWLDRHAAKFGTGTTVFLCFMYWLVVEANAAGSASAEANLFYVGLTAFIAFTIAWAVALRMQFGRSG